MATQINSFISITFLFPSFLLSLFLIICVSNKGFAFGARGTLKSEHQLIHVFSLFPSSVCSTSTQDGSKKGSVLKIVHKHGPCSHLNQDRENAPSISRILSRDQSRVNSIHYVHESFISDRNGIDASQATIPAMSGRIIGSGNYIVTVGLGTPKKDQTLIFDTGSDLTWTQCRPCVKSCYQQQQPIFDPSVSKSYQNITCNSTQCSELTSATGNSPGCSTSTCIYGVQYGDSSFSIGYFGTETLTLTGSDIFPNFQFGCGQNNKGLFGGATGLLGLGRDQLSVVSQTASKFGRYFAYCLPSSSSSSGTLTFGKDGATSNSLQFTPLTNSQSFYYFDVIGIKVSGRMLSIPPTVFKMAGMIIDSGTVISRLPPVAYTALKTSFRQRMTKYPMIQGVSILDTCYDLSNFTTVSIPTVSFLFGRNVEVPLDGVGILYAVKASQVCLAFAGNNGASDVGIFGNVQQQTLEVAYDVGGGKLGFGTRGCS